MGCRVAEGRLHRRDDSRDLRRLVQPRCSYHWGTAAWKTEAVASARGTPFGAAGAWALLGDTAVVFADGVAGTLKIVSPEAGSVRTDTFDLGFAGRPVTDRDLADLEATIRGDRDLGSSSTWPHRRNGESSSPSDSKLTAVHGGLLYGVARDELGVPSVGALVNPVRADLNPEPE